MVALRATPAFGRMKDLMKAPLVATKYATTSNRTRPAATAPRIFAHDFFDFDSDIGLDMSVVV
jgi:hypothetical protein